MAGDTRPPGVPRPDARSGGRTLIVDAADVGPSNAQPHIDPASKRERLAGRVLVCVAPDQLPPYHGGGAQVMTRMLGPVDPADYVFVTFGPDWQQTGVMPSLGATQYRFSDGMWPPVRNDSYRLDGIRASRRLIAETLRRARLIGRVARREKAAAVLVASTAGPDLPAAWLAAAALRLPVAVYLLDDWRHLIAVRHPAVLGPASLMEPHVLGHSAAVMVISPLLAEEIERDWRIRTHVVSHALPPGLSLSVRPPARPWPAQQGEVRLVYTGQVYDAHYDALATILRGIEQPGLEPVTLHIYASDTPDRLRKRGVEGRLVVHRPVPISELIDVQRSADILLLPLGFETGYPEIVRTAVPTKIVEYLVSGRPILVYSPPDSVLATIARSHHGAALVTQQDQREVARALRRIIDDAAYRREIVDGAWATAEQYHSPDATTVRFRQILNRLITSDGQRARKVRGSASVAP